MLSWRGVVQYALDVRIWEHSDAHCHTEFDEIGLSSFEVDSMDSGTGVMLVRRTHLGMRATPPLHFKGSRISTAATDWAVERHARLHRSGRSCPCPFTFPPTSAPPDTRRPTWSLEWPLYLRTRCRMCADLKGAYGSKCVRRATRS